MSQSCQDRSFHPKPNCDGFGIPVIKDLPLWAPERIQQEAEAEAGSVRLRLRPEV